MNDEACEDCPNNTPALCPYENDGSGHCPRREEEENKEEEENV
jgi:hypothetical protein